MTAPPPVWTTDTTEIVSMAMQILRMQEGDPDAPRVEFCAQAAVDLVDLYLARGDETFVVGAVPAAVMQASAMTTTEIYRRKDAPFGVLNAWSPDQSPMFVPRDWLPGVQALLAPYKGGWGIG